MAHGKRVRLLPRETKTATFSTPWKRVEDVRRLRTQVKSHTAPGGTASPTLVVTIEDSIDGGQTANVIDTFAAITTATSVVRNIAETVLFGPLVRATGTITGTTPSFDVSIDVWAEGPEL